MILRPSAGYIGRGVALRASAEGASVVFVDRADFVGDVAAEASGRAQALLRARLLTAEDVAEHAGAIGLPALRTAEHRAQHHVVAIVVGPVAAGRASDGAGAEPGQRIAAAFEVGAVVVVLFAICCLD